MSLTRVASVDGFERERPGSSSSSRRRMSFNPFSDQLPPAHRKASVVTEALQFEEVSKQKRLGEWKDAAEVRHVREMPSSR